MMADFFAHKFADDPKAAEEIEDDDFNPDAVADLIKSSKTDDWEPM